MKLRLLFTLLTSVSVMAFTSGCEDDDYDHVPPSGQGALYIDNETSDDIDVFVSGANRGRVNDDSERAFDLEPKLYRVVLVDRDSDYSYRDDIDILADRLSVLQVNADIDGDGEYEVTVRFE